MSKELTVVLNDEAHADVVSNIVNAFNNNRSMILAYMTGDGEVGSMVGGNGEGILACTLTAIEHFASAIHRDKYAVLDDIRELFREIELVEQ